MQSFSMSLEYDSIQVQQIIEFDGLLTDIFDAQLKVQNMTGREKQKLPFTGLYDYMTYFTLNTFITGLREMPATAHRMMIKIL